MARKPMMAGNWKMNNTIAEAVVLTQEISNQYDKETWGEDVDIVICPPTSTSSRPRPCSTSTRRRWP